MGSAPLCFSRSAMVRGPFSESKRITCWRAFTRRLTVESATVIFQRELSAGTLVAARGAARQGGGVEHGATQVEGLPGMGGDRVQFARSFPGVPSVGLPSIALF